MIDHTPRTAAPFWATRWNAAGTGCAGIGAAARFDHHAGRCVLAIEYPPQEALGGVLVIVGVVLIRWPLRGRPDQVAAPRPS